MQALLPRELCDIVYGYLLADETKCENTKRLESKRHGMFYVPCRRDVYEPTTFERYPYVRNAHYIGIETKDRAG
jgi:hypothetical protein